MGLTSGQDIPEKKIEHEPWSFKRLFPFIGATTALTKAFTNPFDLLLGYLVFIIGITELIGGQISFDISVITILVLGAAFFERHIDIISKKEPEKE